MFLLALVSYAWHLLINAGVAAGSARNELRILPNSEKEDCWVDMGGWSAAFHVCCASVWSMEVDSWSSFVCWDEWWTFERCCSLSTWNALTNRAKRYAPVMLRTFYKYDFGRCLA